MEASGFFSLPHPALLGEIAAIAQARIFGSAEALSAVPIRGVAALDWSRPGDLSFLDAARYAPMLVHCRASACLMREAHVGLAPSTLVPLIVDDPHRAMTLAMAHLFPQALRPHSLFDASGVSPGAMAHPKARLEENVTLDPCAVVGPGAEIGSGTTIGPHAVIGPGVRIGRDCSIGAQVSVSHALIGNQIIIHPGARLGQDGFGFEIRAKGHLKTPQLGRVIVQDDVEIGANTTIDRGALRDTVIGEGAKIDNLVQIGHNVVIGRGCLIVAQTGIAGSTEIGDFVLLGGQSAIGGHLTIGDGASIAAQSGVIRDVPAGARYGGSPARPVRRFLRGETLLDRMARGGLR